MPKKTVDIGGSRPLLDIVSYGRKGPARRDHLSSQEVDHIRLTVERAPEVMIKVLSKGAHDMSGVRRHVDYLSRRGELALETDEGERIGGRDAQKVLLEDWGLDLDEHRRRSDLSAGVKPSSSKLVHKIMFSMPAGTPPDKVLQAVRNFAREEFALQHRYLMVLHTDEPHPHVHMVVKATNEQGERLNIRKETLRRWRAEFARRLRALGVAANATDRAVRGETRTSKLDSIYRAMCRGESSHLQNRVEEVAQRLADGTFVRESGWAKMAATRSEVLKGWSGASELLDRQGDAALAGRVRAFIGGLSPPRTERELIAEQLKREVALQRSRLIVRDASP